jgi:cytosol alanyl aminopeptidase
VNQLPPAPPSSLRRAALAAAVLLAAVSSPAPAAAAEAGADLRLGAAAVPRAQAVELRLDPAEKSYSGRVVVDLEVVRATPSFRFHAEEMELASVELVPAAGGEAIPLATETLGADVVEATAEAPLAAGRYRLTIDFANDFGTRAVGLYRAEYQGESYLFTQFQAVDAREAFPVWDEPQFKIPYRLTLTVPEGLVAATNAPAEAETPAADGWKTIRYAELPPLPSYLLAIAVGPFDTVPVPGTSVPSRILTPKGQGNLTGMAVEMTPPLLAALETWFARPYPYAKLDLVAVPEYWPGAMENPGLITFSDGVILAPPEGASVGQRRGFARIQAHELAHMWFGDLVTMTWWDDLWLNESFADWLGGKIAEQVFPRLGVEVDQLRGVQQIFAVDARPTTAAIRKPVGRAVEAMENVGVAYAKGRAVLDMVEQWLGPETFQRGVRAYIGEHAHGSAEAADLWRALAAAAERDVSPVLAGFLDQPGYPLVGVRVVDAEEGVVELTQQRFRNHGGKAPDQSWQVPMVLQWSDGEAEHARRVLLAGPRLRVELGGPVAWLHPDAGAWGYYRWRLPADELTALAAAAPETLDTRERIAFLGNAAALLDAGAIGGGDYLGILAAFAADPEPEVLAAALGGLTKVEGAFVSDQLGGRFAAYLRSALRPALDRIGMEPGAGEPEAVTLLRPQLLGRLGGDGEDAAVRAFAAEKARAYLADPSTVDPSIAGTVLSIAAVEGDAELFETYRARFEADRGPADRDRFLGALGDFDTPALQEKALAYALAGPLRPTELFTIPASISDGDAASDRVFSWLRDNYATLTGRMPPDFIPFLVFFAGGCSEERLATAHEFFGAPERKTPAVEVQLAKLSEAVRDCATLRRREGEAAAAWLIAETGGASAGTTAAGGDGRR